MFLEFYRLVEFHLLLRLVKEEYIRTFRMNKVKNTVVVVVPLLSVIKDQVKGYRT